MPPAGGLNRQGHLFQTLAMVRYRESTQEYNQNKREILKVYKGGRKPSLVNDKWPYRGCNAPICHTSIVL